MLERQKPLAIRLVSYLEGNDRHAHALRRLLGLFAARALRKKAGDRPGRRRLIPVFGVGQGKREILLL